MLFYQYKRQGFTLIEVTLVIALMGVFYSMAFPRINSNALNEKGAEISIKKMAASLKLARSMAIANQENHIFHFDSDTGQFGVYAGSVSPSNLVDKTYSLEKGVTCIGQDTFTFTPAGASTAEVRSAIACMVDGEYYSAKVIPATGYVTHQKLSSKFMQLYM